MFTRETPPNLAGDQLPRDNNTYVKRIRTKLQVGNKAELTRAAQRDRTDGS